MLKFLIKLHEYDQPTAVLFVHDAFHRGLIAGTEFS